MSVLNKTRKVPMQCPVCKEIQLVMSNRENVEIDYCPQCRGVWLDRGELDKIIERSQRDTAAAQPAQVQAPASAGAVGYQQDYGHGGGHRRSGHGSGHGGFLKRLFD